MLIDELTIDADEAMGPPKTPDQVADLYPGESFAGIDLEGSFKSALADSPLGDLRRTGSRWGSPRTATATTSATPSSTSPAAWWACCWATTA